MNDLRSCSVEFFPRGIAALRGGGLDLFRVYGIGPLGCATGMLFALLSLRGFAVDRRRGGLRESDDEGGTGNCNDDGNAGVVRGAQDDDGGTGNGSARATTRQEAGSLRDGVRRATATANAGVLRCAQDDDGVTGKCNCNDNSNSNCNGKCGGGFASLRMAVVEPAAAAAVAA